MNAPDTTRLLERSEARHLFDRDFGAHTDAVERTARGLEATAAERDRAGGTAWAERQLLRDSGLLTLAVPAEFGGAELPWPQIYAVIRRFAEADSSLAHLFGFQHLQIASVRLFANPAQQARLLGDTVTKGWFWGNATNGLDTRIRLTPEGDHFVLDGVKSFCSGATGADMLNVTAPRGQDPADRVFISLPADRAGIKVHDDWDNLGQRQTDSGTVTFEKVRVEADEILGPPGTRGTPRATLRTLVSQLILTGIYLGNTQGALRAAWNYVQREARPWFASGVARAADDPYGQVRFADLWIAYRGALALTVQAEQALQQAWDRGDALTARERGEVALLIWQAKIAAGRAALDVTSRIFELMGARATAARYGHDRYWRNVRVHTLHDNLDYKLQDIGRWVLDDRVPEPSIYS
jgi:alkylation response protein AidB-like acyl-CoA dehydrogenase